MNTPALTGDKYQAVTWFDGLFGGSTYRVVSDTSKAPIGNNVYGLEQALEVIEERGGKHRLGWMVDSEHIVVDVTVIVKKIQIEIWLRVFTLLRDSGVKMVMYSTKHGAHFIFKRGDYKVKNITKAMTAIGVPS